MWLDRRRVLLGGGLIGAGAAGLWLRPVSGADGELARGALAAMIPERIGPYHSSAAIGLVMPPESAEARLAYSDMLLRLYQPPAGATVMMAAVAGTDAAPGLGVHEPESCYPAAGFTFAPLGQVALPAPVPPGSIARLAVAVRGERRELILYWVRVGGRFPADPVAQRIALLRDNLAGVLPATRLVRLSLLVPPGGSDRAGMAQLVAFNHRLLASLSATARHGLLGEVS